MDPEELRELEVELRRTLDELGLGWVVAHHDEALRARAEERFAGDEPEAVVDFGPRARLLGLIEAARFGLTAPLALAEEGRRQLVELTEAERVLLASEDRDTGEQTVIDIREQQRPKAALRALDDLRDLVSGSANG